MIYCRPSDLVTAPGTSWVAATGVVSSDPHYGLASLCNGNPRCPLKFTTAIAVRLTRNFGAAQRVDAAFLPNARISVGTTVLVQGNATDVWTSPSISAALTIGAAQEDGFPPRPWVDLRKHAGYTTGGYQYWSLFIDAGALAPWIGEFDLVETVRTFDRGIRWKAPFAEEQGELAAVKTAFRVETIYPQTSRQNSLTGTIVGSASDLTALLSLHRDAGGRVKPWYLVVDETVETDGGLFVRFTNPKQTWTFDFTNQLPFTLDVLELSRGIPL